ncbi:MAG: DUF4373 domain-containing protein [Candidatus Spyradocola sp.]
MARPLKMGLDYFPFDVDFFQDEDIQLIKSEHGSLGVEVYMRLLCLIYHFNGYYYVWNERKPALIAQSTGCTPQKIDLIVRSCVKWSLFDDKLFCEDGILTSRSIQRRYLAAIRERARKADAAGRQITVVARYWLVDEIETAQGLVQLAQSEDFAGNNPGFSAEKPPIVTGKTHKVNQRKVNQSKEKESTAGGMNPPPDAPAAPLTPPKLSPPEYEALCAQFGKAAVDAKWAHLLSWIRENGRTPRDPAAKLRDWLTSDSAPAQTAPAQTAPAPAPAYTGKRTGAHNFTQRTYEDDDLSYLYATLEDLAEGP